jgi:TetR/AcrR family transcriptional repressor of nem operon
MSVRTDRKQQTHEKILAAAARLVRERGIAGTSVADAMGGAGLTVGGFYAHFQTRGHLIDEALRRAASEVRALLFSALEKTPPEARAAAVLDRYLSRAHRDEPERRCPFPSVLGEIATSGEHREALGEAVEALVTELAQVLPAGKKGERRARALGLLGVMVGCLSLSRALAGTKLSDELLLAGRKAGRALMHPA